MGIALAACDKAPEPGGCQLGAEPTLEIGLGIGEYAPVPDGGELPLVHGPQGGYHLEIGLQATHIDASTLVTGHLEGTIDGRRYAEIDPWLDFRCGDDALSSWGTRLIYDAEPEFLDGKTTTVAAEVTDLEGTTIRTEATFVIRDDGR